MREKKVKVVKKFALEFKEFITRGNVIDLAVGMIIGAAFTAIVNALVNNIFKPLINSIPLHGLDGLITMLVAKDADGKTLTSYGKVLAEGTVDLTKSIYIDWGTFITAIINFLLTALVLFIIVKVINSIRRASEKVKEKALEDLKKLTNQTEETVQEETPVVEEVAEPTPTIEEQIKDLLTDIRDILKNEKQQ